MTDCSLKDIAIVIPARNEAERIGACLTALRGQLTDRTTVILVINNTTDDTTGVARDIASQCNLDIETVQCDLPPKAGVGTARRMGCEIAQHQRPQLRYLLTTDADCMVAPNWVTRNIEHLQSTDIVCGKINLIESEQGVLSGMDRGLATNEGRYRTLVQAIYARYGAHSEDLGDSHGEAAGASLAFRPTAYFAVGGFENIACGEDRHLVRAFRSAGYKVRHAEDVIVSASCRLEGRATGGMSDALKVRITGTDYLIDDCLPDAQWLLTNAISGTLGVWPPLVSQERRVHIRDLPQSIDALEIFLSSNAAAPVRSAFGASGKQGPAASLKTNYTQRVFD